jgi:hypothetical protein
MLRLWTTLFLALTQTPVALDADMGVLLHGEQAEWLLVPRCSRRTPVPVDGYWAVSADTIQRLEEALEPVLREAISHRDLGTTPNDYYRQYAGAIIGGRPMVYISAFHRFVFESARAKPDLDRMTHATEWRTRAIGVTLCDGGPMYWGAEFDPATGEADNVLFSGSASGLRVRE